MRLRPSHRNTPPGEPASRTQRRAAGGAPNATLRGSWSATRWQYTSRERPEEQVDVVCDLGGSVTLSLSEGTYVLTWDVGRGSRSVGGAVTVEGERLVLHPEGAAGPEEVLLRLSGDTLALSAESSAWEFDGDGQDEAAAFVAVLVRL